MSVLIGSNTAEPNDIFHQHSAAAAADSSSRHSQKRRTTSDGDAGNDADIEDLRASSSKKIKKTSFGDEAKAARRQQLQRVYPQPWSNGLPSARAQNPAPLPASISGEHEDEWRNIHVVSFKKMNTGKFIS